MSCCVLLEQVVACFWCLLSFVVCLVDRSVGWFVVVVVVGGGGGVCMCVCVCLCVGARTRPSGHSFIGSMPFSGKWS